ncbi:MAG: putative porin [Candidatus Omnitrophota bacterium]
MKKFLFLVTAVVLMTPFMASASEIDVLLNKLVEKGVLTPIEAQIVKDETQQDVARQMSKGTMDTLPDWIQTIKLKGDLRLRFQTERKDSADHWKNRGRYRLRFGAEANPLSNLKVGFGLASGDSNDSRSTNETFDDNFSKDDVWIDYAYAEYTPMRDLKMIGGKFASKDYLWKTTDLLWDSDINPEGASVHYDTSLSDNADLFVNGGTWVIDEIASQSESDTDPFMHYLQSGVGVKLGEMDAKLAGVYYGFNGVQGNVLDHQKGINTGADTGLVYDYDSVGASAEVGIKKALGGLPLKIDDRIALFGDYIQNISEGVQEDSGWAAGIKFGHAKIKEPKSWQAKYLYAVLEKDAWLDTYPDSDRYSGKTNMKGHEVVFEYALKKNVTLGLDYYRSDVESGSSNVEHLVQADVAIKF